MPFWSFEKTEKDKYLAEARKCKRRGEFDRAGDYFFMAGAVDEALAMYVQGGHHQLAAQMLEKKGDLRPAAEHYVQARDLKAAANLYVKLNDWRRASQLYEKLGEHFKAAALEEGGRSYKRAGELFVKAGHLDRASASYARDGDHLRAAEMLESHLNKVGMPAEKELGEKQWTSCADLFFKAGRFRKAAEIWSRFGHSLRAAEAFEQGGEWASAVEMYLKAQEIERAYQASLNAPDGALDRRTLADLNYARGQWREAADLYRELREPSRAAECYEKAGETALAASQYEMAGDLEVAADLLYGAGEYARASQVYERAMRFLMAARAADEASDAERAARLYGEAHEPVEAAKCWRKLGQVDQAIGVLQQVPATHDGYGEASILLADLFREKGLHSIALDKYRAAVEGRGVDEATIDAYYGMALLHEDQGEAAKAIEIYERIVATSYTYRDVAKRLEALRKGARAAATPARAFAPPAGAQLGLGGETQALPADPSSQSGPQAVGSTTGVFGRRYEVIARIGSSARGEIYKAWDSSLGRTVVLKRLAPGDGGDDALVRRYLSEAQQASKLHHSNIATIYDAVDAPDGRFVATEYVFGESLRQNLAQEGHLTPARAVEIVSQVLIALEYAHGLGVTHRNLRPENVLIAEKSHVKLTDFGMSRRVSDLEREPFSDPSPLYYVSPEQLRGEPVDARADLYAVGVMLYEMLLGKAPFTGPQAAQRHLNDLPIPPTRLDPSIPASLEKVVLKAMEKDPAKRFANARQAYEELRAFDFMPGLRLGDRYELLRELGTGGMGKVYMARDLELDETIAMKVLRPELGTDTMLEQRFIREIKLARRIVHPSVVKVYDFGKWKNIKYITMEYIDGMSLDDYVKKTHPPNVREIARYMIQIAEALDAAHKLGVVHRDIKPQNVLLSSADNRAKLVDFGIARVDQFEDLTSSRLIIGSPKYMSPEQISGKGIDHRTDLYSLGVVMYYCFTGMEPFVAEDTNGIIMKQLHQMPLPPCQVNPDLPPWVEMMILKALVKDPRGRFQRASEVSQHILTNLK